MLPQNFISSPTSSEKPETSVCLGRQRRKVSAYHAWPPPWGRLGQLEDQYGQERISQSFRALVTLRRPRILEDFCHEGDINKSLFPCPISVGKVSGFVCAAMWSKWYDLVYPDFTIAEPFVYSDVLFTSFKTARTGTISRSVCHASQERFNFFPPTSGWLLW